jgi:hypothetical protein
MAPTTSVLARASDGARITAIRPAGDEVWLATKEIDGDEPTRIGTVEGDRYAPRFAVPRADCWDLACTGAWVYAAIWRDRVRDLWRAPRAGGSIERLVEDIDAPELQTTPAGELVYAREGQILVRDDDGGERGILPLPGPGTRHRIELQHRIHGATRVEVTDLRAVIARVAMATSLVCTDDEVLYCAAGDTTAHARVYRVALAGGEPEIWLEGHRETDDVDVTLGAIAVTGSRVAATESRVTRHGKILASAVVVRSSADRAELARHPTTGRLRLLRAMDEHVVWAHALGAGGQDRLEASIAGSPAQPLAERTGDDLRVVPGALLYGDGAELRRMALSEIAPATITSRERAVVDAIRASTSGFELTSVGGRPAVRTTRVDGSRSIQFVSDAELANIRRALGEG